MDGKNLRGVLGTFSKITPRGTQASNDWVPSASFVEADCEKTSVNGQKLPEMVVKGSPTFASGMRKSEITQDCWG